VSAARLSVVIPTHDRLERLREALGSALAGLPADGEVVVVDDGSTDGTWAWLTALGDRRCRSLRNDGATGASRARNRGVEAAAGDFVVFLDDDDELRAGALAAIGAALARHPAADFAWGGRRVLERDAAGRLVSAREELHVPPGGTVAGDAFVPYALDIATSCAFTIRRAVFLAMGGFDGTLRVSEDREFFLRLAEAGRTGCSIAQSLVDFNVHQAPSLSRSGDRLLGPTTDLRVIDMHRPLLERAGALPEYLLLVWVGFLHTDERGRARALARELGARGVPWRRRARLYLRHGAPFRALKRLVGYHGLRRVANRLRGAT
jgi:glycosyltransferase involved in cell wall biosynthesis